MTEPSARARVLDNFKQFSIRNSTKVMIVDMKLENLMLVIPHPLTTGNLEVLNISIRNSCNLHKNISKFAPLRY
ncbi:hypothetical protein AFLA_007078 [Aspergillus flavus NRRL3357]|nr:hypothetical protein AFLA_007078 [Aspergillus flavus NRRL3357]